MMDSNSETDNIFKKMNRTASEIFNRQAVNRELTAGIEIRILVMAI